MTQAQTDDLLIRLDTQHDDLLRRIDDLDLKIAAVLEDWSPAAEPEPSDASKKPTNGKPRCVSKN